ncbi:hypothetical protein [Mycetocola zhadangensis]|uniref:Uncharacterized protein n=1 Tax=Mycetocola zhadangensis TaxID=1164595 RepID=A0A3L7IWR7_9MICO|nr:hypothetical protein [Mycetocola zhadangensis]RLQ82657.1 hypothetical protein D9V28_11925 [Mycetocola zhadangensis]GGE99354.1 hypothetical protein GCM10011313_22890 [Mycetocola zhadangensis]
MGDIDYDKLSEQLTDAATPLPEPHNVRTGAAAGREFLLGEYGGETAVNRAMRRGCPRVGASS